MNDPTKCNHEGLARIDLHDLEGKRFAWAWCGYCAKFLGRMSHRDGWDLLRRAAERGGRVEWRDGKLRVFPTLDQLQEVED